MTKLLVWGTFIFTVGVAISFHDGFSKRCDEAGGWPVLTLGHAVCLHPSAVIELKEK